MQGCFLQNIMKRYLTVHSFSQPDFKTALEVIFSRITLMVRLLQSRADKSSAVSFSAHVKKAFLEYFYDSLMSLQYQDGVRKVWSATNGQISYIHTMTKRIFNIKNSVQCLMKHQIYTN